MAKMLTDTEQFRKHWNNRLSELYDELNKAYDACNGTKIKQLEQEIACIYREYPSYAKKLKAGTAVTKECETCIDCICTARCIK